MQDPMVSLARLNLSSEALCSLASELLVHSELEGAEDFARYKDASIPREVWLDAVRRPPCTTAHVNACIVKPRTQGLGGSFATTILKDQTNAADGRPLAQQVVRPERRGPDPPHHPPTLQGRLPRRQQRDLRGPARVAAQRGL